MEPSFKYIGFYRGPSSTVADTIQPPSCPKYVIQHSTLCSFSRFLRRPYFNRAGKACQGTPVTEPPAGIGSKHHTFNTQNFYTQNAATAEVHHHRYRLHKSLGASSRQTRQDKKLQSIAIYPRDGQFGHRTRVGRDVCDFLGDSCTGEVLHSPKHH
jgi:hypothetical protein